jgi:long-chain acyl-CoA synthetase
MKLQKKSESILQTARKGGIIVENKELTGYPSIDKPWLKYYSEEAKNASVPECSIYEYLVQNNKNFPSDVAIIYLGRKITYRELFINIDKTASAFLKAGIKEKEIVTIALPSIPEALYCVYALNKIGAVANMIHPLPGKEEMLNYFNEVESKIAVIFDGAYDIISNDIGRTNVKKVIVASPADSLPITLKAAYILKSKRPRLDGKVFQSWKSFIKEGRNTKVKTVKKDCREMAIISHTGGTTGEPKGVMCSDVGLNALMLQIVCNFSFRRQGCSLSVLPPFVNYSLVESMMAMLAIGYKVVLIPKYEREKLGDYIKKYKPTIILSIPSYWEALLEDEKIYNVDMSCLEQIYYGGEGMTDKNEKAINLVLKKCGSNTELWKGLGSTEMTGGSTQTYADCNFSGSVGIPLVMTDCIIVDPETGKEVTYDYQGEICFTGPSLMLGYYQKPKETNDVVKLHGDGRKWFHTGDLGYITEDGVLYVTGRIKRIFMTKGKDGQVTKLFPDRIEKIISSHQSVDLCCVVGVPDKGRIHYPKAYIVLKELVDKDQVRKEIEDICKQSLPEYMVPEEIELVSNMPRTHRGKIDFRALEALAEKGEYPHIMAAILKAALSQAPPFFLFDLFLTLCVKDIIHQKGLPQ